MISKKIFFVFPLTILTIGTAEASCPTARSAYAVGLKPSSEGSSALAMNTVVSDAEAPSVDREPAHVKPVTPTTEIPAEQPITFSATAYLASDYIWRGQTFTPSGQPVIQGSGDVALPYGFGAGLFLSNLEYLAAKSEADLYATWAYSKKDWGFGTMAFWYNYVEDPGLNAMEYTLWARYKTLKLETNFLPEFFGLDSTALYSRATITQPLTTKETLNLAIGYFHIGNEANVTPREGYTSYMDYEISLVHLAESFNAEFQYTNTNRRNGAGVAYNDSALTFILSRTL